MKERLLRIYDWLETHRRWLWIIFAAVLVLLVVLTATLRYNEDIMDFLPVSDDEREALEAYQSQQAASRVFLIIEGGDEQQRTDALDEIDYQLSKIHYPYGDSRSIELSTDPTDQLTQLYAQLPFLIADSVYDRFDSLFTQESIRAALQRDRTILNTPGTSFLVPAIQSDPLGLVNLSSLNSQLSTDRTYAFFDSPYGSTETKYNAALMDSLNTIISQLSTPYSQLNIRWIGAPVIAVGNARRIKIDTVLCISLSLVLILVLLAYAFPRRRDLWLILLSVSFGWLTGMAVLRLVTPSVSIIVLGIGSVLIGIAVNYPLHLLVHQRYTTSVRQTLSEVLSPLVVGNITTVGAFLTLVPLQAAALRHLGIFAAAMLVGTILFCIFVMPHLMSAELTKTRDIKLPSVSVKYTQWTILALTLVFGAYLLFNRQSSSRQLFDSNLTHINYMTPQQRADMASFENRMNDAVRWTDYWSSHDAQAIVTLIQTEAEAAGFRPAAFQPFYEMLLSPEKASLTPFSFSDLTERLSDDFDYIGLCCSLIVFIFLWLSFHSFWLALIAFLPMALSWVWILALMQLFGMQFNIVNIILATFIFGQGDDYTIFIVEGLLYEQKTGKPMLPQYRQSIILSALSMLLGIGILVLSVHPAMHSLGTVMLIGMLIVLLMSFTIPPILFRFYTRFLLR